MNWMWPAVRAAAMTSARAPTSEDISAKAPTTGTSGAVRLHLLRHGPLGAYRGPQHAADLRGAREVVECENFLAVLNRVLAQSVPVVACPRLDVR
jgi:hypothetical protein